MTTPRERFAALHRPGAPLVLPNAWDVASGAALAAAGFPALGTTSLGVAAAHGHLDAEGRGQEETLRLTSRLTRLPVLVTVDLESGFAEDPAAVAELVVAVAGQGAVGVNLEDGRPGGRLAAPAEQERLLREVRRACGDIFLNARVDTHWLGAERASTLERAHRYVVAGADGIFVPGALQDQEIAELARALPVPLNLLALPGRQSVECLAALGTARVSTGSLLYRAALGAAVEVAQQVRASRPLPADLPSYAAVQALAEAVASGA